MAKRTSKKTVVPAAADIAGVVSEATNSDAKTRGAQIHAENLNAANTPVGVMFARKGAITINQATPEGSENTSAKEPGLWRDGIGKAATRSAQSLLIVAAAVVIMYAIAQLSTLIVPILIALIVAAAMRPVMVMLQRWHFSPLWSTVTALIGLIVVLGGVVTMIVNSVRNQIPALAEQITEGLDTVQEWLTTLPFQITDEQINNVRDTAISFVTSASFGSSAVAGISATGVFLTGFVLMLVVLFFFLKDGPQLWEFLLRPFTGEAYDRGRRIGTKTVRTLGSYVRGTATVAFIDALGIGIGLAVLSVPLALPLAVVTFLLAFIPLIGATVAGALAALVALVSNGPVSALIVVAIILIVQQLEGNFLQPKIMGSSLSLHPLVILLSLTAGTILMGILGALLAVPIVAVVWSILSIWDGPTTPAKFVRLKDRSSAQR